LLRQGISLLRTARARPCVRGRRWRPARE
jgi:hypothetical protein